MNRAVWGTTLSCSFTSAAPTARTDGSSDIALLKHLGQLVRASRRARAAAAIQKQPIGEGDPERQETSEKQGETGMNANIYSLYFH